MTTKALGYGHVQFRGRKNEKTRPVVGRVTGGGPNFHRQASVSVYVFFVFLVFFWGGCSVFRQVSVSVYFFVVGGGWFRFPSVQLLGFRSGKAVRVNTSASLALAVWKPESAIDLAHVSCSHILHFHSNTHFLSS